MQAQHTEDGSPLHVVRAALAARRRLSSTPPPTWLVDEGGVLAFRRGDVTCVLNTGDAPVALDRWGGNVLVASRALDSLGRLPAPGTAWLR